MITITSHETKPIVKVNIPKDLNDGKDQCYAATGAGCLHDGEEMIEICDYCREIIEECTCSVDDLTYEDDNQ